MSAVLPLDLDMTCPDWCRLRDPRISGHVAHMQMFDFEVEDGPNGDGRAHWPHQGPDVGDARVWCTADTFLTDPTEHYVHLTADLEGDLGDPAELRTLGTALIKAAEWLEAHQ